MAQPSEVWGTTHTKKGPKVVLVETNCQKFEKITEKVMEKNRKESPLY